MGSEPLLLLRHADQAAGRLPGACRLAAPRPLPHTRAAMTLASVTTWIFDLIVLTIVSLATLVALYIISGWILKRWPPS